MSVVPGFKFSLILKIYNSDRDLCADAAFGTKLTKSELR